METETPGTTPAPTVETLAQLDNKIFEFFDLAYAVKHVFGAVDEQALDRMLDTWCEQSGVTHELFDRRAPEIFPSWIEGRVQPTREVPMRA